MPRERTDPELWKANTCTGVVKVGRYVTSQYTSHRSNPFINNDGTERQTRANLRKVMIPEKRGQMRAIILLFANILFSSIPGKYRDNAESFAINKYTSERGRKCQSYKMFKSSKVSAAHFGRRDRNESIFKRRAMADFLVPILEYYWPIAYQKSGTD